MLGDTLIAMMALYKASVLIGYSKMCNTEAYAIQDTILSDIGFDLYDSKKYNLGGNTVRVSMAKDLTLRIYDTNRKECQNTSKKENRLCALWSSKSGYFCPEKHQALNQTQKIRNFYYDFYARSGCIAKLKYIM